MQECFRQQYSKFGNTRELYFHVYISFQFDEATDTICNKYKNVFAPGTLGVLPDTYLVPVSYIVDVGVWHIDVM